MRRTPNRSACLPVSCLITAASASFLLGGPLANRALAASGYSNNPLAPTVLSGSPSISISGTVVTDPGQGHTNTNNVSSNSNYVTFTVPQGFLFQGLSLKSYNSADNRAFVALMAGNTWTASPPTMAGALAYHHFGTGAPGGSANGALCAQAYLNRTPSGSENCVNNPAGQSNLFTKSMIAPIKGPLPAGAYTMWIQQTSSEPVDYVFEARFSPVPGPLPLLGAAAGWGLSRRLRQRIKGSTQAA